VVPLPAAPVRNVYDVGFVLCSRCLVQVLGDRLGRPPANLATLVLVGVKGNSFVSRACVYEEDNTRIRCVSPPGVGAVAGVNVLVDGVRSVTCATTLAYSAPVVLLVTALSSSTSGGVVYVSGRNFGPVSLNAVDAVSYTPVGWTVAPRLASCNVTQDDVQLTCVTSGGVGAKVC
jgi:hypothetical protein